MKPPRDGRKRLVATRFVRACPKGHVADIDWRWLVHGDRQCPRPLWLIDRDTGGDLTDLIVRCECGASKRLSEAADRGLRSLGRCPGTRPWLGPHDWEQCELDSRLLIRTATNAYFPQVARVLSVPEQECAVEEAVAKKWPAGAAYRNSRDRREPFSVAWVAGHRGKSHLERALRAGALCSSDPVWALHRPDDVLEGKWLHGAACHNCSLIAETSCEMRNEFLDRALVVPTLDSPSAAFFNDASSPH